MPKTLRNVYDKAVSFDKLLMAHKKARKGKREKREVIIFELNGVKIDFGHESM